MMPLKTPTQVDRISVFYNMNYWQKFIAECLKPYILLQKQNQQLTAVFIAFNFFQGSNIRIAFEFVDEVIENRTNELHRLFTNYLQQNTASESDSNFIGTSLFMDFPNNSCQQNLFHIRFSDPNIKLQLLISEKIIDVFSADECNGSSLFTFLLHVIIAFCKEWEYMYKIDQRSRTTQILLEKFSAESESHLDAIFQPYHELFLNNRKMILGIYEDVVQDTLDSNFWCKIRSEYRQFLERNLTSRGMPSVLLPLDLIIADQLGLNDQSLYSVYYLIKLIDSTL